MIIEMFGISGVGKSTISKILIQELKKQKINIFNPISKNQKKSYLIRNIIKIKIICSTILNNLKFKHVFFKIVFKYNSFLTGIKIFYNFLYYIGLESFYKNYDNIILEEGPLQSLLAVIIGSKKKITKEDIEIFYINYNNKSNIISVDCSKSILKNRIKNDSKKRRINKENLDNVIKNYNSIISVFEESKNIKNITLEETKLKIIKLSQKIIEEINEK